MRIAWRQGTTKWDVLWSIYHRHDRRIGVAVAVTVEWQSSWPVESVGESGHVSHVVSIAKGGKHFARLGIGAANEAPWALFYSKRRRCDIGWCSGAGSTELRSSAARCIESHFPVDHVSQSPSWSHAVAPSSWHLSILAGFQPDHPSWSQARASVSRSQPCFIRLVRSIVTSVCGLARTLRRRPPHLNFSHRVPRLRSRP